MPNYQYEYCGVLARDIELLKSRSYAFIAAKIRLISDRNVINRCWNIGWKYRKGKKMNEEIKVTQASDNIFEYLGFTPTEAASLKVRADLMLDLRKYILSQGWTQEQAAEFFSMTQPRISNLMNGEVGRFIADKLINMLAQAGMEVRVEVLPKVA